MGAMSCDSPFDVARARADTPGCEEVVHLNHAGCSLAPRTVEGEHELSGHSLIQRPGHHHVGQLSQDDVVLPPTQLQIDGVTVCDAQGNCWAPSPPNCR